MRAVIQRVQNASVTVKEEVISRIGPGFLVLLGVENEDTATDAEYIANKIAGLRVFEDEDDKLNRSILDTEGEILLVSQFTLYGDVRKGRRPSFIRAAGGDKAPPFIAMVKKQLEDKGLQVKEGRFGAHMQVSLLNDGPVTILIDSRKEF